MNSHCFINPCVELPRISEKFYGRREITNDVFGNMYSPRKEFRWLCDMMSLRKRTYSYPTTYNILSVNDRTDLLRYFVHLVNSIGNFIALFALAIFTLLRPNFPPCEAVLEALFLFMLRTSVTITFAVFTLSNIVPSSYPGGLHDGGYSDTMTKRP